MDGYAQVIGSLMILFVIVIISHRRWKRKPSTDQKDQAAASPEPSSTDPDQKSD
ncbi:hypothetical protein Enr10x_31780 [Gimesia panareensis]|uniref:Uncharacterized protein n=1 Tax=Gimesia panareensis TaxID=2527978 RepID=A0A517Q889_9PLAN|nr:hypothetical protein [Gimesia panareensis]QDT27844.1 hypothetical protein Enr10x_31780 [Gimesia panareensis]